MKLVLEGWKIEQVATWPDDLKRAECAVPGAAGCNPNYRPETALWHFVDIPVESNGLFSKDASYCRSTRQGDCIVLAIDDFVEILKRSTQRPFSEHNIEKQRSYHDALAFLVHFLGDLHQPLHCAERNHDGGGNSVQVTWQNAPTGEWKLHSVWDGELVKRNIRKMPPAKRNYTDYAIRVVTNLSVAERDYAQLRSPTIKPGTPENVIAWAEASHVIARNVAYNIPTEGVIFLDQNYFNAAVPEVEKQLRLGGVRLARILNEIFDKDIQ